MIYSNILLLNSSPGCWHSRKQWWRTTSKPAKSSPLELSLFTCSSESFPDTAEGWLPRVLCRALYSKFLHLVWHRLNLLIFRACMLQVIYYASCCGGGPLRKSCVWERRVWYSASILVLFSDFVSRLLEQWIGIFSVQQQTPKSEGKKKKKDMQSYYNSRSVPLCSKLVWQIICRKL